jgi:hypothetical protein
MSLRNQLIGTWRSHRNRTLNSFAPYLRQKELGKRRIISSLFGKLEVKWTNKYIHSVYEEVKDKSRYEIVDESDDTLIIKIDSVFPDEFCMFDGIDFFVIQFDETRYYKYYCSYSSRWKYVEWFQKVK